MTTTNALRTILSIKAGLGQREVNSELHALGLPFASRRDLAALGGHENAIGVWELPEQARSCTLEQRLARGTELETLSYQFKALGFDEWSRRRAALITRWIREDSKVSRMRRAA